MGTMKEDNIVQTGGQLAHKYKIRHLVPLQFTFLNEKVNDTKAHHVVAG